jgi:hypothetical protein
MLVATCLGGGIMLTRLKEAPFEPLSADPGARRMQAMLGFEAPYLADKLVRLGIAESKAHAEALFLEVKKYLALAALCGDGEVPMFSTRVDQVWHEFVLFTREYALFCKHHVGHFMHHSPLEAAGADGVRALPVWTFDEFRRAYEACFGALSPIWFDELALAPDTRLGWAGWIAPLAVTEQQGRAVLLRHADSPQVLCRTDARARAALEFIARHHFFLVRELPGLGSDRARLELCEPLVKFRILHLA